MESSCPRWVVTNQGYVGTEAKNIRNSHHQSILLPKPHNLHYPAQEPTLWSWSEAHCKNKHKFFNICFLLFTNIESKELDKNK